MYAIKGEHITKRFKLYRTGRDKLRDLLSFRQHGTYHTALDSISFTIEKGTSVGFIGVNGSGKSTLSHIVAGVSQPTDGSIHINGISSLISIGAGLNNQLTGIENIEVKSLMLGLSKSEIDEVMPKMIEFAELGDFIHQPLKTYSSGMKSRLGFAISVHLNPDIFIIDEALSVGDASFTDKCLQKMNEFRAEGKTIIFISHSLSQMRTFCERIIWLHKGKIVLDDEASKVTKAYQDFINEKKKCRSEAEKRALDHQLLQQIG